MAATVASVALLALVMALFMLALVGWLASFRSTEAGVLLPSTSSCSASRALWFAFEASPVVRLVLRLAMDEELAATRPSAAARSAASA